MESKLEKYLLYGEGSPKKVLSANFQPITAKVDRPEPNRFSRDECMECGEVKGHSNSCVKSE